MGEEDPQAHHPWGGGEGEEGAGGEGEGERRPLTSRWAGPGGGGGGGGGGRGGCCAGVGGRGFKGPEPNDATPTFKEEGGWGYGCVGL